MKEKVEKLIEILEKYYAVRRKCIDQYLYNEFQKCGEIDIEDERCRESLREHVWFVPIVASYLHQFLDKKDEVSLWHTLELLSVHDIWETVVGDVFFYDVSTDHEEREKEAAKELLPAYQFEWYEEFSKLETKEAKFARSVDRLSPLCRTLMSKTEQVRERRKRYWISFEKQRKSKEPLLSRDPFVFDFFQEMLKQVEQKHFS